LSRRTSLNLGIRDSACAAISGGVVEAMIETLSRGDAVRTKSSEVLYWLDSYRWYELPEHTTRGYDIGDSIKDNSNSSLKSN
jgi:hypothetical protein